MAARLTPVLAVLAAIVAGCGGSSATPKAKTTAAAHPAGHRRHHRAKPALKRLTHPQRVPVPILMYHVINVPPPGTPYPQLWVSKELFAAHLAALHAAGYHAVTLQRVWDAWTGRYALPSKPIVISFDDGYLSQYTHAKPALHKLGWPGVLNLKVGNIGPGGLSRRMVRSMIAAGWEVDAHTITHPDLTTLGPAQLEQEVAGSRAILRRDFHAPVAFFCYPAGRFNATVEAAVRKAGYLAATTTQPGLAAPGGDPDALPRIRVNAGETAAQLMASVRGATVSRPTAGAASGD